MDYVDLHIHSNRSDGLLSVDEIIDEAVRRNLKAISITDHDNVDAIEEAQSNGIKRNIEVIPGIELSAELMLEDIHILGYYINYKDASLKSKLAEFKKDRRERANKIIEKLNKAGFLIKKSDVNSSKDKSIGRPDIARALMQYGYVNSVNEAFEKYLGRGCPQYVPKKTLTPEDAIDMIKRSNGIAVLAHPGLIKNKELINRIISMGIDALEVYHSRHDENVTRELVEIAERYKLLVTGGSDFHGSEKDDITIGCVKIPYKVVEDLKERREYYDNFKKS